MQHYTSGIRSVTVVMGRSLFRRVLIRSGILIILPLIIRQFVDRNNADGFALDLNMYYEQQVLRHMEPMAA